MTELRGSRLMIAAPQAVCDKLSQLLAPAGIAPDAVCHSGAQALELLKQENAVLLTTWRLEDMTGAELAEQAGESVSVMMIVPQGEEIEPAKHGNVLLLRNPLSPDALVSAVRATCHCDGRLQALRKKAEKLARMLEDRKVIERAKGRLMELLHLSESEAHYHIQKKSMDTGKRIADIAREILESEEAAAI
ncbi:MAG: ANTAR domain-containing protein [Clostridia bacterium]|nr:ANTAR domain-containing protein [Clostridia bacterium]